MSASNEAQQPPGRIVVVGAGECGTRAAMELRGLGYDGELIVLGREMVPAYERPPLSKGLFGEPPALVHPYSLTELGEAGVDLRLGVEVTDLDAQRQELVVEGEPLGYDALLLATGSVPRTLEGLDGVTVLRTHEDAAALAGLARSGGHLLVVGGGLIGLEVAASARQAGLTVTVVEAGERPLQRVAPSEIADRIGTMHVEHGVDLRTRTTLRATAPAPAPATAGAGGRWRAELSDDSVLEVDRIVAGVGARPATELAEQAGLRVSQGIVVDELLRTSDPHIWAAGDVAIYPDPYTEMHLRPESWRSAHDTADTVAASMLGGRAPHAAVPWLWSEQYDAMLQISGSFASAGTGIVRRPPGGVDLHLGLAPSGRVVAAAALGPGPAVAREIRAAERLIASRALAAPTYLADPDIPLRSLAG